MLIDMNNGISQRQFSDIIGVSEAAVSGMVKSCVITPGQSAGSWLKDYCAHLREVAAGRLATGDIDLSTERALLAKEQRLRIEMQNAVTRKELAPVFLIEEVLAKAGSRAARILDTIPGLIRRRAPDLNADILDAIKAEVAKARNIAAAVSMADLDDIEGDEPAASADACTVSKDDD